MKALESIVENGQVNSMFSTVTLPNVKILMFIMLFGGVF